MRSESGHLTNFNSAPSLLPEGGLINWSVDPSYLYTVTGEVVEIALVQEKLPAVVELIPVTVTAEVTPVTVLGPLIVVIEAGVASRPLFVISYPKTQ